VVCRHRREEGVDVFVVQHVHNTPEGEESVKFIGVYSTDAHARAAIQRLTAQLGFCGTPDGFHVDRYSLDEDHWTEGFVTA
jgi:hypothetical protein